MWFDRGERSAAERAATGLTLGELLAMRPRSLRGVLTPGERFPTGMRPGRRRSQGLELDGISPYVQGDDVRRIDWRATARTGRTQVKRYLAESHRARMLVVDLRPDMYFGTRRRLMAKTAALAAARLAWEALGLHEPVGLLTVPGRRMLRPRRGRRHLLRLLDRLEQEFSPRTGVAIVAVTDLASALEAAAAPLAYGDEVSVISDFGSLSPAFAETSRALSAARRLQAIVVEDDVFTEPLPPGRYPLRRPAGTGRKVARLSRRAVAAQGEAVAELRRARAHDLAAAGWTLLNANDLIPGRAEPEA